MQATISWNDIKQKAVKFSKEWENTTSEEADAKSFLDAFFDVFGISRKKIGTFEHKVKKLSNTDGYIDLLWKSVILVEMKSRGKDLNKAFEQAKEYTQGLSSYDLPKYILVCDFHVFKLYDTENQTTSEFTLPELDKHVEEFGFIIGVENKAHIKEEQANIDAALLMGNLHDSLKEVGYLGHDLEVYLVRLLFCLFAEDTTIFNLRQFQNYIEQRTNEDGSDLAAKIHELFEVLNTPETKRLSNIDQQLNEFPYVNGSVFEERLALASFDRKMRDNLIDACKLNWSYISPEIFGSMFQSVMNPKERRNLGAHYTSETNILRVIKPLFLDELWKEFQSVKSSKNKLQVFHDKIASLKFLDPACGCGNFLIITYRELRLLELEIIQTLLFTHQKLRRDVAVEANINIGQIVKLNFNQFYGIEYEEFPAKIAEIAMYLIDHQMNMLLQKEFGQYIPSIPLKKGASIIHGDSLEINWQSLLNPENTYDIIAKHTNIYLFEEPENEYKTVNIKTESFQVHKGIKPKEKKIIKFDYIIGNPPFIGSKVMSQYQRNQIVKQFDNSKGCGVLDYVSGWYIKAAKYIQNSTIKVAFVSTNSIVQGEQTAILWGQMLNKYGIKIHFAHKTFKWSNEAKGNAAVYCVIVGFANYDSNNKILFEYEDITGEPTEVKVKNINPYLVDAKDIFVEKRRKPICNVPEISFGSMPNDGGNLIFDEDEKNDLFLTDNIIVKYTRPLISGHEFLNGKKKWCLWLENFIPSEIAKSHEILKRLSSIKKLRENSTREATKKLALFPNQFGENRQPKSDYIFIPLTSSENRRIIPMAIFNKNYIANNTGSVIANSTLYHLGILQSSMHMAWVNVVCGRLKGDYRYSNEIVYNNFPWPENITDKSIKSIEIAIQKVLDIREKYNNNSLSDLYNTLTMPPSLIKAHQELDKAVDLAYRSQVFTSDAKRMEFLFELYEKYTADLFTTEKGKKLKK